MPANTLDTVLATALSRLAGLARRFEPGDSLRAQKLLAQLGRRRFSEAASLIRFHEILLFLAKRNAFDDLRLARHTYRQTL